MGNVVKDLEEADRVEFPFRNQPGPHDVADNSITHTWGGTGDRRFTWLDAPYLGVSLLQRLLEEETVTASDLEKRFLATTNPSQPRQIPTIGRLEVGRLRFVVEGALGVKVT